MLRNPAAPGVGVGHCAREAPGLNPHRGQLAPPPPTAQQTDPPTHPPLTKLRLGVASNALMSLIICGTGTQKQGSTVRRKKESRMPFIIWAQAQARL